MTNYPLCVNILLIIYYALGLAIALLKLSHLSLITLMLCSHVIAEEIEALNT